MNLFKKADGLESEGISFVIVTLTNVRGEAPQDIGAKAIISQKGLEFGTVGGGKVEARAIKKAQELLESNTDKVLSLTWNLQTDIGMTCGGEVEFLFEVFQSTPWPIVVFGAGHVAQALTRTLLNLNCQVTCIDHRREWVEKLDSKTKSVVHAEPAQLVQSFAPNTFFISMTQGHAHDVPILYEVFKHFPHCLYVGVIGSEIKGKRVKMELKEMGASSDFLQKLRVPIGLPLGSNHPYEIAVSIVAELIQVRDALKKTL